MTEVVDNGDETQHGTNKGKSLGLSKVDTGGSGLSRNLVGKLDDGRTHDQMADVGDPDHTCNEHHGLHGSIHVVDDGDVVHQLVHDGDGMKVVCLVVEVEGEEGDKEDVLEDGLGDVQVEDEDHDGEVHLYDDAGDVVANYEEEQGAGRVRGEEEQAD